jgi:hypothetical protein
MNFSIDIFGFFAITRKKHHQLIMFTYMNDWTVMVRVVFSPLHFPIRYPPVNQSSIEVFSLALTGESSTQG